MSRRRPRRLIEFLPCSSSVRRSSAASSMRSRSRWRCRASLRVPIPSRFRPTSHRRPQQFSARSATDAEISVRASDVTWVLTTGEAGMRSQALGLAEAVGLPIEEKRIVLSAALVVASGRACCRCRSRRSIRRAIALAPPWPRLVVGCGRRSIGAALAVKRAVRRRDLRGLRAEPRMGAPRIRPRRRDAARRRDRAERRDGADRAACGHARSGSPRRGRHGARVSRRRPAGPRRARRRRQRRLPADARRSPLSSCAF